MMWIAALLFAMSLSAQPKSEVQVYPFGEKVGASDSNAKNAGDGTPIDLEMARGEYEIFSIVLPAGGKGKWISKPRLIWKVDKTSASKDAAKLQLNTYWLGVHRLKASSYRSKPSGEVADIPIPLEWLEQNKITVPKENQPSKPTFLFEILTSADSPTGKFTGELIFEWNKKSYKIPLRLTVHKTVLPKQFELANSFGFAPWGVLKKHYGKWHKDHLQLYEMYERAALEHRIDLHKLYVKFPKEDAVDPLADGPHKQSFLEKTKPLFDGARIEAGQQMKITDLPIPEEYKKVKGGKIPPEKLESFWKKMNATVLKHGLKDRTFVYFVDEPKKEDLAALGEDLRAIRKWAPDLRFLVTTPYRSVLEGAVNLWCVGFSSLDRPTEKSTDFYLKRKEKNENFWLYVGCNAHGCSEVDDTGTPDLVIDRASAYQRAFPWIGLRYKAEGILYYDTVYGYTQGTSSSPWTDAFSFTGYGEGNLFYPCSETLGSCKEPRVISSLRMKILRDGFEDVQLMTMALKKSPELQTEIKKTIGSVRDFKKSAADYEKLKRLALKALEP